MVKDPAGKELRVEWSPVKANEVEINLPLQQAEPGALTLFVSQFGANEPHPVELRAYPEAGRFESFSIHAGESHGVLKGSRLRRCRQPVAARDSNSCPRLPAPTCRAMRCEWK